MSNRTNATKNRAADTMAARSPETPYEPFFMRWRRAAGPWIKQMLAPEHRRLCRWWWERVFVPVPGPAEFVESQQEIRARLATKRAVSSDILNEAKEIFKEPFDRAEGVERRATTLQGAVVIAASFVLAGAGLLLDPSRINSPGWRLALTVVYVVAMVSLVLSAVRALRATSRILVWHYADSEALLRRQSGATGTVDYELDMAAELLFATGRNAGNARYKVAQMRAASHWFALAIVALLLAALMFAAYALVGPEPSADRSPAASCQVPTTASNSAAAGSARTLPWGSWWLVERGMRC